MALGQLDIIVSVLCNQELMNLMKAFAFQIATLLSGYISAFPLHDILFITFILYS